MTVLNVNAVLSGTPVSPAGWDVVVLSKLIEWERVPMPADAEFDPPTAASLLAARAQAAAMRDAGDPPPTRVGPDGSGGVAFETLVGSSLVRRVEVSDVGQVDLYDFTPDRQTMRHTAVRR